MVCGVIYNVLRGRAGSGIEYVAVARSWLNLPSGRAALVRRARLLPDVRGRSCCRR